jgi:hypothetical protein
VKGSTVVWPTTTRMDLGMAATVRWEMVTPTILGPSGSTTTTIQTTLLVIHLVPVKHVPQEISGTRTGPDRENPTITTTVGRVVGKGNIVVNVGVDALVGMTCRVKELCTPSLPAKNPPMCFPVIIRLRVAQRWGILVNILT